MYQVEDEPVETIHLYVVREEPTKPSLTGIILSVIALSILIAIGVLTPYQQPVQRASIRVPAVPLGIRSFSVSVAIIPTGVKTYPATIAHGTLTITNGSVIAQILPAGFTSVSKDSISVVTDRAVYIPAGTADGYGYATVPAHALLSGKGGNFARLAINQVIGSSVYIRNLTAFQGGSDSYSVKYITSQDKQLALSRSRDLLTSSISGLHYPCSEQVSGAVTVTWRCQFITYHIRAFYHVTGVRIVGKNLIITVWFVERPSHFWAK